MRALIVLISLGLMVGLEARAADQQHLSSEFAAIEQGIGGRLGVAALDTGSGRRIEYRAAERFPMYSTYKFLVAAAILQEGDAEPLNRRISYSADDLLEWSPITKKQVWEGGMTVGGLCAAAIEYSDNTAGYLLLRAIGGPAKLTEYIRSLGDQVTRLDRTRPSLNSAVPGDERDTTTPSAMVSNLKLLLLGDRLSRDSQSQLEGWLVRNTTGAKRIRAGLPPDWSVGDKTGTGPNGTASDIAIVRPPEGAPILIAIYLAQSAADSEQMNSAIAKAASLIARELDLPSE